MGKTQIALLAVYVLSKWHHEIQDSQRIFIPALNLCRAPLVKRWFGEIVKFSPYFNPVVSYNDEISKDVPRYADYVFSFQAIKDYPNSLNQSSFHTNLRYIFDKTNAEPGKVLILTPSRLKAVPAIVSSRSFRTGTRKESWTHCTREDGSTRHYCSINQRRLSPGVSMM